MKRILVVLPFLFCCITLFTGCASTRDPNFCPKNRSVDEKKTCEDIYAEYKTNTDAARDKISKNSEDDGHYALLGFLVLAELEDFKHADGPEGNALLDRNVYLKGVAKGKGCDTKGFPSQPSRYN